MATVVIPISPTSAPRRRVVQRLRPAGSWLFEDFEEKPAIWGRDDEILWPDDERDLALGERRGRQAEGQKEQHEGVANDVLHDLPLGLT